MFLLLKTENIFQSFSTESLNGFNLTKKTFEVVALQSGSYKKTEVNICLINMVHVQVITEQGNKMNFFVDFRFQHDTFWPVSIFELKVFGPCDKKVLTPQAYLDIAVDVNRHFM